MWQKIANAVEGYFLKDYKSVSIIFKIPLIYTIFAVMEKENKKLSWLRRYIKLPLVLIVGYLAFVLFFNEYSIAKSIELDHSIDSLRREIKSYRDTAQKYILLNEQLNKNPQEMERVVREQHHMNHTNEDVYVFE